MKLNVIKRFCKEAGGLTILDAPTGEQWIGEGHAFYALRSARVDEGGIAELMGLDAKALNDMLIRRRDAPDWRFSMAVSPDEETPLQGVGALMGGDGELYTALRSDRDLLYIKSKWLDVIKLGDYTAFALRVTDGGAVLVAVYNGLTTEAVIGPEGPENSEALRRLAMRMAGGKLRADDAPTEAAG